MKFRARGLNNRSGSAEVDMNQALGRGATAVIYRADFSGNPCAAKIYNADRRLDQKKISAMLENPPSNIQIELNGILYPQLAWPFARLQDDSNRNVGYLMPLVDLKKTFSLDHFYDQVLFKKMGAPTEGALSFRLEIARNLCLLVADLHDRGHYFIDMKPQNIRVWLGSHVVTLVDCDGFSIAGNDGTIYPAELLSSDYVAPEAYRSNAPPQTLGEAQDCYALSVIIFQLLNRGTHPFQGIIKELGITATTNDEKAAQGLYPHGVAEDTRIAPRPQSIHHLLDDGLRDIFDKAFIGTPGRRPKAKYWANRLDRLLRNKSLVRCSKEMFDIGHMRFSGKDCPACYISDLPKLPKSVPIAVREEPKVDKYGSYGSFHPSQPYVPPDMGFSAWLNSWWPIVLLFLIPAIYIMGNLLKPNNIATPAVAEIRKENEKTSYPPAGQASSVVVDNNTGLGLALSRLDSVNSLKSLVELYKFNMNFKDWQAWESAELALFAELRSSRSNAREADGTIFYNGVNISPYSNIKLSYKDSHANSEGFAGLCYAESGGLVCESSMFRQPNSGKVLSVLAWGK
jgi:hypothetical protein